MVFIQIIYQNNITETFPKVKNIKIDYRDLKI